MSRTREGYLMVDHRFSPGLTEDEARVAGYDPNWVREGKLLEAASLTCSHCKTSVMKNPLRQRERAYCPKCDHYICDFCAGQMRESGYSHTPFEKLVDKAFSDGANVMFSGTPATLILP